MLRCNDCLSRVERNRTLNYSGVVFWGLALTVPELFWGLALL